MPYVAKDSVLVAGRQYDAGDEIPGDAPTDLDALVARGLAEKVPSKSTAKAAKSAGTGKVSAREKTD